MKVVAARSVSPSTLDLLDGRLRRGVGLGHGYVALGDYVLALTRPRTPRMPNGIETAVTIEHGERARIGGGELRIGTTTIVGGPLWDPVPNVLAAPTITPAFEVDLDGLAGWGPGLTPLGDDVLVGYVAGLVLFRAMSDTAAKLAARAAPHTTALAATLLHHAARGELPEPAHVLLEQGDPEPLLRFGATSGAGMVVGLALARGRDPEADATTSSTRAWRIELPLPGRAASHDLRIAAVDPLAILDGHLEGQRR